MRRVQGFTFLELLVAMTLMAITAGSLYSSLYTGFRARRSAERAIIPVTTAQSALEMIEQDIRGSVDPNTALVGAFQGINAWNGAGLATDKLVCYSTHHSTYGDPSRLDCGIGQIELGLVQAADSDTYDLVRNVTDNLLPTQTAESVEEVLCRRVRSLNLRYFDGSAWTDQWNSDEQQDTLPVAVEVTLEIEPLSLSTTDKGVRVSRYDSEYLSSICKLTQVMLLPSGTASTSTQTGQTTGTSSGSASTQGQP